MKLHFGGLGDHAQSTITIEHADRARVITAEDLGKKKEHNQAMLEIVSSLGYVEFYDIKSLDSAKKMWDALTTIYGGDTNVLRDKAKSLKGKFDDMRMQEGETIAQYSPRIKDGVNAIRGATGTIYDDTILRKTLRTLLPIYAIRVFAL